MPVQVIDENISTTRTPHLPKDLRALLIRQVMKGERADHRIERRICKRQECSISNDGSRAARAFQSRGINVERNNPAGARFDQRIADITAPGRNVEYRNIFTVRQET